MNVCLFLPIAALLMVPFPAAAATVCDAVIAASLKVLQVPAHLYTTETGARNRSSEVIYFNGVTYLKVEGQWRKSAFARNTVAEQKKESEEKIGTCAVVRDEAVGGEPATLYKVRNKSEDAAEVQIWISKMRGLVLKQSYGVEQSHTEIRYEYSNVTAPTVSESPRK